MNQLKGKYVNVVLAVEEGRGMEFIKGPITITANLNGRVLETDSVEPEDCPQFNTELVWEIDKKDLRKIRSSNQPLRVECFTVSEVKPKVRVGFALMSLRSAQIITEENLEKEIPCIQQKLIGVQQLDKKIRHPEISLSLTIRDQKPNASNQNDETVAVVPYISEEDTDRSDINKETEQNGIPVKYLEDGFICIGEPTEADDVFMLNLLIKTAANLDLLLPEVLVFSETKKQFYMSFKIFGASIKTKPFERTLQNILEMNEKIVVRILSNKEILRKFLRQQKITITFFCSKDKLGISCVELAKLEECLDNKLEIPFKEICFFKYPSANGIIPTSGGSIRPCVDIETNLLTLGNNNEGGDSPVKRPKLNISRILSNIEKGSGDQVPKDEEVQTKNQAIIDIQCKVNQKSQSEQDILKASEDLEQSTKSENNILKNCPLVKLKELSPTGDMRNYQHFCLEVALKNFSRKKALNNEKCLLTILHPKAASCIKNVEISRDTVCKFRVFYITTPAKVTELLKAWPPKVFLSNSRGNMVTAEQHIFFKNVQDMEMLQSFLVDLKTVNSQQPAASFEIVMALVQWNVENFNNDSDMDLMPVVLDEEITVREVEDIEKWKLAEKAAFKEKLREMSEAETEHMRKELKIKTDNIEEELNKQLNKCKELQKELQDKVNSFKTERLLEKKRQNDGGAVSNVVKDKTDKYAKYDQQLLLLVVNKLECDNQHLKNIITQQNEDLRMFKKSALTREQTASLLQELRVLEEKFQDAQKAKSYFKNQWKRACEEIHELRAEDYKQLQDQIRINKEQLSHLSLDHFVDHGAEKDVKIDGFRSNRECLGFTML